MLLKLPRWAAAHFSVGTQKSIADIKCVIFNKVCTIETQLCSTGRAAELGSFINSVPLPYLHRMHFRPDEWVRSRVCLAQYPSSENVQRYIHMEQRKHATIICQNIIPAFNGLQLGVFLSHR